MNLLYVDELLKSYDMSIKAVKPKRLVLKGFDGYDIYNPTAPFTYLDKTILVGRVEKRDSEISQAVFFQKDSENTFSEFEEMPRYTLQDPFITKIGVNWVFGGTEIFEHPDNPEKLWWRTQFYYGEDLKRLQPLAEGPNGMKDIRLVELADHRIGVITRPQGVVGGMGEIGFAIINKLTDLSDEVIAKADLLNLFNHEEWGGANELRLLENGHIGVLGHIAKYGDGVVRHYYPMAFTLNPLTRVCSPMKIIATRDDFIDGPSKRADLMDVLFSAGLILNHNKATLYVGVSDVEVQCIEIENPFIFKIV